MTVPDPSPPPAAAVPSRPSPWSRLRRYPASAAILGLTALVFAAQVVSQPVLGFDLPLAVGAKVNEMIVRGQLWRLVTPALLHIGLLHFAVNGYSLYILAPLVESGFGAGRMLLVYLLSSVVGVSFSLAFSPAPSAGASSAIFGLLGAVGGFLFLNRALLGARGQDMLRQILFLAIINLGIGLSPGIDNWAHVGGLLAGLGLAFSLGPRFTVAWLEDGGRRLIDVRMANGVRQRALLAVAITLVLAYAAIRLAAI